MAQDRVAAGPDKIELYNAITGNIYIGAAKALIGGSLLLTSLFVLFTRPFQMQALGLLLAGAVLAILGAIDLRRSADRALKLVFDGHGVTDHRSGMTIPWSVVTAISYNPKTTPYSSAMLGFALCPFVDSGLAAKTLPKILAAWPGGKNHVALEMTTLAYNSDRLLAGIERLSGMEARNILRKAPPR